MGSESSLNHRNRGREKELLLLLLTFTGLHDTLSSWILITIVQLWFTLFRFLVHVAPEFFHWIGWIEVSHQWPVV